MKDKLTGHNNQLVHFKTRKKNIATTEHYAIVIDGRLFELFGYQWQECFGILPSTGKPKILLHEIHPSKDNLAEVREAPFDSAILKALCDLLRSGQIGEEKEATISIDMKPVHCDVRILKSIPLTE